MSPIGAMGFAFALRLASEVGLATPLISWMLRRIPESSRAASEPASRLTA